MNHSPVISPKPAPKMEYQVTMDFPEAMQAVIDGKTVTKIEWALAEDGFVVYLDGMLKIRNPEGKVSDLIISEGDMTGTDWVVVEKE